MNPTHYEATWRKRNQFGNPDNRTRAYIMGMRAKLRGQSVGTNPFNMVDESVEYEQWVDGWSAIS